MANVLSFAQDQKKTLEEVQDKAKSLLASLETEQGRVEQLTTKTDELMFERTQLQNQLALAAKAAGEEKIKTGELCAKV